MQDSSDEAQRHAILPAEQKGWWYLVFCRQKGYEEVLWWTRQYMVPRAQEPPHSLVQMELVFWLTKKLSWNDGLNNSMVSLIGHHLSMMKLSTQVECNPLLDQLPTICETVKAIKLLSSGKAPRIDAIPAEIYKAGGPPVAEKLTELFHIMWRKEAIPQEFKDVTIIHLF